MSFDYDLFVIGGGSGGVRSARLTAQAGFRVGLAEEYRMGGTCVIRGCVPKKLLVYASEFPDAFEDAAGFGWTVGAASFDWATFMGAKDKEIARLEAAYRGNLEKAGVEIFDARATLADPHTVSLSDGRSFSAKHILIATGGAPFVPEFPGSDLAGTSNDVFLMDDLPRRLLVVGGGYIACEFAGIFNGLGSHVTQFYRGPKVLRGFDQDLRDDVSEAMRTRGVDLRTGIDVASIERDGAALTVTATDGSTLTVDRVIYATGRRPSTAGLGLEAAGVELAGNGAVVVDEWSQTRVPSIHAVGDVTDRVNLTPVAIREGVAFVETVFKGNPTRPDHALIATAVFTQPEIGTIGMTEEEACEHGPIEVYLARFRPMRNILAGRDEKTMMKLVVAQDSRRVLGVHILGHGAGEMIQLAAIAVKMGATKEDFDRTVAVHPTAAEELVTMSTPVRMG